MAFAAVAGRRARADSEPYRRRLVLLWGLLFATLLTLGFVPVIVLAAFPGPIRGISLLTGKLAPRRCDVLPPFLVDRSSPIRVAHHSDHEVRCVGVDSYDVMVGLLGLMPRTFDTSSVLHHPGEANRFMRSETRVGGRR